jgi:Tfp pilus assembly protein PilV
VRIERARSERAGRSWMTAQRERLAERVAIASEAGDTLIEVLISALVIGVIIVGTFNGLDTTNRAAALGRFRSQAQALAEKDQERLRGEPISAIQALNEVTKTSTVEVKGTAGKTVYTITSKVEYINETGASDCAAEAAEGYYKTISKVAWTGMGANKPVIETGSIAPPAGATLIVRVEGAEKGVGVEGMTVTATAPASAGGATYTETTTAQGCALFGPFEKGGEYTVNVLRSGYVDNNWYSQLSEDKFEKKTWNLLVNVATKAAYRFAPAGTLKANLTTVQPSTCTGACTWSPETKAVNLEVADPEGLHPEPRSLFKTSAVTPSPLTSESPGAFPFPTAYAVYAGTCEANNPAKFGSTDPGVKVPPLGTGETEVPLPAMIVDVYKASTASTAELVEPSKLNKIVVKDTGCSEPSISESLSGSVAEIEKQGDLRYPGMPYGKYTVCNEWVESGSTYSVEVTNDENPETAKNYDGVQLFRGSKVKKSCPT